MLRANSLTIAVLFAVVSFAIGCGGRATTEQAVSPRRRFEVKTRDVFDHSFAIKRWVSTDKDETQQASLHPQSDLGDDCADGWEPYATERVTENTAVLEADEQYAINRVFVRYYLKREVGAWAK